MAVKLQYSYFNDSTQSRPYRGGGARRIRHSDGSGRPGTQLCGSSVSRPELVLPFELVIKIACVHDVRYGFFGQAK